MSKSGKGSKRGRAGRRAGERRIHAENLALSFLGVRSINEVHLDRVVDRHVERVLDAANGNLSLTAAILGVNRRTMQRYMRRRRRPVRRRGGRK
jgi:transcriptional regulator of acetoin/glycerol metabolism